MDFEIVYFNLVLLEDCKSVKFVEIRFWDFFDILRCFIFYFCVLVIEGFILG